MSRASIPVTILGGSDRTAGSLPRAGLHPLATYKGVAVRVDGRPLVAHLAERLLATPGFGPVWIAGPARVYEPLALPVRVVDTDATVGANLAAAIRRHESEGGGPLGVLACDVLPSLEDLALLREAYQRAAPCALWFPFVRVPDDPEALGAFGWKPTYPLAPGPDAPVVRILPGHLAIFEPTALRLPLLHRLLDLAYKTRNRSIAHRRAVMLRKVLFSLLGRDLRNLLALRAPTLTATVLSSGLELARRLRAGRLEIQELELLIGRIFLRREVAALPEGHGIRYPILDVVRLAQDVDTEEEARQVAGEVAELGD